MTSVLLIGTEIPLLEGLSQSLAAGGHRTRIAPSVNEGVRLAADEPPLVAVVQRALAAADVGVLRIPLVRGGALVLYRSAGIDARALSPALQRTVLAELALPLERHRLVALIQWVDERARATGRSHRTTPPEQQAQ